MKPITLLTLLALTAACGKEDRQCKSQYQKVMECASDYNETHNPYYVQRVCLEKYPEEGCYK
jgi:hypothetical protein